MASLTTRDDWVRARWSGWLKRCLDFEGVTVNSLSRHLARNTMGDYRGTIKSYCRGETTVTAERVFEIGEAIASLAPCGWVSRNELSHGSPGDKSTMEADAAFREEAKRPARIVALCGLCREHLASRGDRGRLEAERERSSPVVMPTGRRRAVKFLP